jgi:hypothetical protein
MFLFFLPIFWCSVNGQLSIYQFCQKKIIKKCKEKKNLFMYIWLPTWTIIHVSNYFWRFSWFFLLNFFCEKNISQHDEISHKKWPTQMEYLLW